MNEFGYSANHIPFLWIRRRPWHCWNICGHCFLNICGVAYIVLLLSLAWKQSVISFSTALQPFPQHHIKWVKIHASLPGCRIVTIAPVSAALPLDLWESSSSKNTTYCLSENKSSLFSLPVFCHKKSQFPRRKRLLCGEGVSGSLFLLSPTASPSLSRVTCCLRASPAPSCRRGKSAPRLHPSLFYCLISTHFKHFSDFFHLHSGSFKRRKWWKCLLSLSH